MNYEQEIIKVLEEVGDKGLTVKKISRHVYNACNSLFEIINYDDVYAIVYQYLSKNSKNNDSVIEKMGKRGRYRLNIKNTQQLMLDFHDYPEEESPKQEDNSLSLF